MQTGEHGLRRVPREPHVDCEGFGDGGDAEFYLFDDGGGGFGGGCGRGRGRGCWVAGESGRGVVLAEG